LRDDFADVTTSPSLRRISSIRRSTHVGRPAPTKQYEIFYEDTGWRWRLVESTGRVLAAAPSALTKERCLTAVRILQLTTDAPLLIRAGGLPVPIAAF
jgi:hypothetical protein